MDTHPILNKLVEDVGKENNLDSVNKSIAHIDQRLTIEENILSKLQMDNQQKRISMNRSRLSLDLIESEIMDLHRKFADIKEKKARLQNVSESNSIEATDFDVQATDFEDRTDQIAQIGAYNPPTERQLKTNPAKKPRAVKGVTGKKPKQIERVESAGVPTNKTKMPDLVDTNSNVLENIENVPEVRTRPQRLRTKPKCCIQCQHDLLNANIATVRQKRKASKPRKQR